MNKIYYIKKLGISFEYICTYIFTIMRIQLPKIMRIHADQNLQSCTFVP